MTPAAVADRYFSGPGQPPRVRRRNHGRGHSYQIDGDKVIGVTTAIGNGLPKPALTRWAAREVASFVVDNKDVVNRLKTARGHIDHIVELLEGGGYAIDVMRQVSARYDPRYNWLV